MKEGTVKFDYEAWIRGNPYRYKTTNNLSNITNGHINTARTYFSSGMYNDAKRELIDAYRRIDLFAEDIQNENLNVTESEVSSLRNPVMKAELELFGESELRTIDSEQSAEILTA